MSPALRDAARGIDAGGDVISRAMVADDFADDSLRDALAAKLDDMTLHDETGDPRDEGYMDAVRELREWLSGQTARRPAA